MSDTSFLLNHWKNKFKRLIIEVHYLKNRTTYKDHVIQIKDPNKPLITLRTGVRCLYEDTGEVDPNETELTQEDIDPNHFIEVEGRNYQFSEFTHNMILDHPSPQSLTGGTKLGTGFKDLLHSIRSRNDSDEELARLREVCDCFCHEDNVSTINDTHNNHCVRFCVQINEEEDFAAIERLMSNQVINYIEPETHDLRRRKYWLFGPRISLPVKKAKDSISESPRIYNNIEIIAQSFSPPLENEKLPNSTSQLEPMNEPSSYSRKLFLKSSALSEQNHINKDQKECKCPICERNKKLELGGTEPWKVVMNDISLYAALVSTGSKPNFHLKSSMNLAADFTSSKHQQSAQLQQKLFIEKKDKMNVINDSSQSHLISFNDENENNELDKESDLLSLSVKLGSQGGTRTLGNGTIKYFLENTKRSLSGSYKKRSLAYDSVFQDYDYSDDEPEEIKSLKKKETDKNLDSITFEEILSKLSNVSDESPKDKPSLRKVLSDQDFKGLRATSDSDKNVEKLSKIQMLQKSFLSTTDEIKPLKVSNVKNLLAKFS